MIIISKSIVVTRYSMNHMLELLLALGANVNYQGATESLGSRGELGGIIRNWTALHWAVGFLRLGKTSERKKRLNSDIVRIT